MKGYHPPDHGLRGNCVDDYAHPSVKQYQTMFANTAVRNGMAVLAWRRRWLWLAVVG